MLTTGECLIAPQKELRGVVVRRTLIAVSSQRILCVGHISPAEVDRHRIQPAGGNPVIGKCLVGERFANDPSSPRIVPEELVVGWDEDSGGDAQRFLHLFEIYEPECAVSAVVQAR